MSQEFEDPRKELLEDLLQWLDWQASCGGEVWPVDNIAVWNQRLSQSPKSRGQTRRVTVRSEEPLGLQSAQKKGSIPESKDGFLSRSISQTNRQSQPNIEEEIKSNTTRPSKKPKRELTAAFTSFLQARAPSIDFAKLDEQTGLKTIKEHQRRYCSSDTLCAIGAGRPANPVLVIEGHSQQD